MRVTLFSFCSFITFARLATAEEQPAPMVSISMYHFNCPWQIRVVVDGSGSIQYGSGPEDNARFPKGTVPVAPLLEAAQTKPIVPSNDPSSVQVAIPKPGESRTVAASRDLEKEWESIGKLILAHLETLDEKRVGELLAKYPLVKDATIKPQFQKSTDTQVLVVRRRRPQQPVEALKE